ncbi:glucan biosynthesis protein [Rubripirellula obstinata]|nr:glucan biosynthesis protein [Rubripirellula obstinata]
MISADQASADAPDVAPAIQSYTDVHNFDQLCVLAKALSKKPVAPTPPLPEPLASWNYDDYIKTSFKSQRATWFNQQLPFWLETFHRGFVQVDFVDLFTLIPASDGAPVCQRIKFSKRDFNYAPPLDAASIPDAGHAGVKIVGRFPGQTDAEEVLSFLGSSYFRARSADCVYGASVRGLAINIAMNQAEEFPDFRAFWIRMPSRDDDELTVLAHMDSASVSGAYQFRLKPGNEITRVHVDAKLYFRSDPEKLGIAPITSMWMWGDGLKRPPKDARPSVHDSDGLLVRSAKQRWTWRAFARQSYPSVTSIGVDQLLGFGMIQRDREFLHYDDHNARYDKRPSVWVTPDQPWSGGNIELLELPGAHEGVDNLGAYWVPDKIPGPEDVVSLGYTIDFFAGDPSEHNVLAKAIELSVDRSKVAPSVEVKVRFAGPALRVLPESSPPRIQSELVRGSMSEPVLTRSESGDWTVTAKVTPSEEAPVELKWQLFSGTEPVSENFQYLLPPTEPEFVYPAVYTRQE